MAFIDQINLAKDPDFQGRVQFAVLTAAIQIANEVQGNQSGTTFDLRQALARSAITGGINASGWALLISTNPAITVNSTDGDIQFTVNSMFNAMAGVTAAELA